MGHTSSVTGAHFISSRPSIVVTASKDRTFKVRHMTVCDLVMCALRG